MHAADFDELHAKVKPLVEPAEPPPNRPGTFIPTEFKLSSVIRYLAGAAVYDQAEMHGFSDSTFFIFLPTYLDAIYEALRHSSDSLRANLSNTIQLQKWANTFERKSGGALRGCVGAIDGLCIHIMKPIADDSAAPALYYNRKGFYSM